MQPETHESYLPADSNPLFRMASDSSQAEDALAAERLEGAGEAVPFIDVLQQILDGLTTRFVQNRTVTGFVGDVGPRVGAAAGFVQEIFENVSHRIDPMTGS
jgi:hypothetical protein